MSDKNIYLFIFIFIFIYLKNIYLLKQKLFGRHPSSVLISANMYNKFELKDIIRIKITLVTFTN